MKLGAWIHDYSNGSAEVEIAHAARCGFESVRGYHLAYCEKVAPWVAGAGLSMMAGISVASGGLLADWRSQVKVQELELLVGLPCRIEAVCVGNELREGGDAWESKRFTARLSFALARVLEEYRRWLADHRHTARLTYAMEGIVFDSHGSFREHLWPLIDACDIVSLNSYPMSEAHWRDFTAFEVSRSFLRESKAWRRAITEYEARLRRTMDALVPAGKTVVLSEAGFPSGVGYRVDGKIGEHDHVWPEHDTGAFRARMQEYVQLLATISRDYAGALEAVYFYEWWDNHYHKKIWNIERSPIHSCFGLCDHSGTEKADIAVLARIAHGAEEG